jgi:undecaprenyl-phosphate 4-deoxy-4-formamido-L-arabinose transferase
MPCPSLSIVIPCFDSEQNIQNLCEDLTLTLEGKSFEIILVCDDSRDSTWKIIQELGEKYPKEVKGYLLGKNVGQHRATLYGMSLATGERVVTMDDDGQHLPGQIQIIYESLTSDLDVVYGVALEEEHGFFRNFLSRFFKSLLTWLGIMPHAEKLSSFRCINRRILPSADALLHHDGTVDTLIFHRTNKIRSVTINMQKRKLGKSNYNMSKLVAYAAKLLIFSSQRSMKIISLLGGLGVTISTIFGLITLIKYLNGQIIVPGYTSTLLLTIFFSSLTLVILGLMGQLMFQISTKDLRREAIWIRSETKQ